MKDFVDFILGGLFWVSVWLFSPPVVFVFIAALAGLAGFGLALWFVELISESF